MFTGFQISAGLAVIGAIVGDFFFGRGEKGLGNLIQLYVNRLRPEMLFGALFFSTLLGLAAFLSVRALVQLADMSVPRLAR